MTDKQTPPGWVLIEAAKRCGWPERNLASVWDLKQFDPPFRALCDMIERYEARPVDRKLLCAREAMARAPYMKDHDAREYREGKRDQPNQAIDNCVRAIELWEEGFGK